MALREIYKVFAPQIIISERNPQGILSNVTGLYTKLFSNHLTFIVDEI